MVLMPVGGNGPVIGMPGQRAAATSELVSDENGTRVWQTIITTTCRAPRHDSVSAYKNLGCRCPEATRRTINYQRRRDLGKVAPNQPAVMTVRRLQALAVIGWTSEVIGEGIGRHAVSVSQIRRGVHEVVTGATAHAVHRVYRQLHNQRGPSDRCRAHAQRMGWDGPTPQLLAFDVDEVAVRRACAGDTVHLERGERLAAVQQLRSADATVAEIARRLHVSERQVARDLADIGPVDRVAS